MIYNLNHKRPLFVGERGENGAEVIQFDCREWQRKWPDGQMRLLVKLSKDPIPYYSECTYQNGIVEWSPTAIDTRYAGRGKIELQLTQNETIVKSAVFEIEIMRSLDEPTEELPHPVETWLETLTRLGNEVEENTEAVRRSTEDAQAAALNAANKADAAALSASDAAQSATDAANSAVGIEQHEQQAGAYAAAAAASATEIDTAVRATATAAQAAINQTKDEAVDAVDDAIQKRIDDAIETIREYQQAPSSDDDEIDQIYNMIDTVMLALSDKVDGAYVEDGYLTLTANDTPVVEGLGPFSGGGGGGGGSSSTYIPKLTNNLPSRTITIAEGNPVSLNFDYESVDGDGYDDGAGSGTISLNGSIVKTLSVIQGTNIVNISDIVVSGTNSIKVRVENSEGVGRSLAYTVTVIALSVTTPFDPIAVYTGDVAFNYTVFGSGQKVIHYVMDGTQFAEESVSSSGRSRTRTVPAQSHGAHLFECYATTEVNGETVESNVIRLSMVWIGESSLPIIASTYNQTSIVQGNTVSIPYMVYDPTTSNATVQLTILNPDGTTYSSQTITRNREVGEPWSTQDYPAGNVTFRITCRNASVDFPMEVIPYTFPIHAVTDSLQLEFNAVGRSNTEANPAGWSYGNITASFDGFGWRDADGWVQDADNVQVLRFMPGDTMTIPFYPFASDARQTGYTIEVEMATRDVRDYESIVLTCFAGEKGFRIASQNASIKSEQSTVSMLFKEDDRVRVTFVIEQRNLNRFIYIYINGIMCGITQYPTNDNFQQSEPVGLTIGAESCGLDLYRMRFYSKGLNRGEQLDNFICDRSTLVERRSAYDRNNILNGLEEVDINKLPNTLPYIIIACPELPQSKGDKKENVSFTYVDPVESRRSFTATGTMDVQGTSSAVYPVKNFKPKMSGGFVINGTSASKYAMYDGALPVSTFCFKADYASCEGANNVELVELYERTCRAHGWLTPPQTQDSRIRQGIAGHPMVVFWRNTTTNTTTFVGKYNFNNDKSTENVFGFDLYEDTAESWEFRNNTTNHCLFKDATFTPGSWENDFEARYPEDNTDTTRLKRVFDFVVAHNRDTVSTDVEKAEMLADFKAHFDEYFDRSLMLFYYLFTEVFLMVDSRAKNMFLTTYDGTHWLPLPYDFDTSIGILAT